MSGSEQAEAADSKVQPQTLDLTPPQAAARLRDELALASQALASQALEPALDAYARALGLALQLGPAAAEAALDAILAGAGRLAREGDAEGLCALGPAVTGVVTQVEEAGVLPATAAMQAWAHVAADVGALVGQVGLALALPVERRTGLWRQARARAALLDEATGNLFSLVNWLARYG